jgi:aryl-alcohol dehydrogenase-like predicted oxidoreductase
MSVIRKTELTKVRFGRSDMMVTECCIGTMTWGSFNGKEEEAFAQLDKAVEMGANFFDTAELYPVAFNYGKTTEAWMGKWLTARTREGKIKRQDLYIATKCNPSRIGGPDWIEGVDGPGKNMPAGYCHSYEADILEKSCRASIERLCCGYIDLYQLHWPTRDCPIFGCFSFSPAGVNRPMPHANTLAPGEPGYAVFERQLLAIKRLLDAGLIKNWGLSNENAFGITMFCTLADKLGMARPVSCQNDFSLLNRTYESDTWEAAYRFGVVGLPYGCLAGGVLTGKYFDGTKWSQAAAADRPLDLCRMRKEKDFQPRYGMPMAMLAAAEYIKLAEQYGITPTELALSWARQRQCNTSIITGTTTVLQMEECINAFKIELPEELMKAVDVLHEQYRHPTQYFVDKPACMDAKWLGSAARSAKDPQGRLTSAARSPLVRVAVAAAAAGAAVALLITRPK